ncbi:signal peptidase I [Chamaesiphon sp.]|uniref:signal peptidase I n=1 Tax=Chamaesiphon sp. TaxID=2814140 RepID=UPI0035944F2E
MNRPDRNLAAQTNNKEPWLAVNLSWLLPGMGQMYAGRYRKGWTILLGYYLLGAVSLWFFIDPLGNALVGMGILIFTISILLVANLFDAYRTAITNNSIEFESHRKETKDAWVAVFLSGFLPGLGHIYLKRWLLSIVFMLTALVTFYGTRSAQGAIAISFTILRFIFGLLTVYFAYTSTPVRRDVSRAWIGILIAGLFGIPSIVVAFAVRTFVAEARYIPAGSMQPTLAIDDRLIINKLIYHYHAPERGDIIVFNPTAQLEKENFKDAFIKRIIGIPGDRIDVKDGKVYVNGNVLDENYLNEAPAYNWSSTALTPDSIIPEGNYLVLGDNRNNSYDSHYWGFVPKNKIIGKATQRFWPFNRIGAVK